MVASIKKEDAMGEEITILDLPTAPEIPEVEAIELDVDFKGLPIHIQQTLEMYEQSARAYIFKLESVLAAQDKHFEKMVKIFKDSYS